MGATSDEVQAVVGEVTGQGLVDGLIVEGVAVHGPEALDVIGDLGGGRRRSEGWAGSRGGPVGQQVAATGGLRAAHP